MRERLEGMGRIMDKIASRAEERTDESAIRPMKERMRLMERELDSFREQVSVLT